MESVSVAGISAWQQQNLAMQVGISVLKNSMDIQAQSAMTLLESVVAPMAEVSAPGPVADGAVGQNIDVLVGAFMKVRRLFRPGRDDPAGVSYAEATRPERRFDICPAHTAPDRETVRELFREYEQFLNVDWCFQGFAQELATLPGRYASPRGQLLLARKGEQAAGCVALRPLQEEGACEMKRLFVRPAYRGQGLGRLLAMQIVNEASALGYAVMRLDTLETLDSAMHLYTSLGFQRRAPYDDHPLPGVVYGERALPNPSAGEPDRRSPHAIGGRP